jgi:hypothetical protein
MGGQAKKQILRSAVPPIHIATAISHHAAAAVERMTNNQIRIAIASGNRTAGSARFVSDVSIFNVGGSCLEVIAAIAEDEPNGKPPSRTAMSNGYIQIVARVRRSRSANISVRQFP